MLIVSDDHRRRAGVSSLDELCPYCGLAFTAYPLIMSDDPGQTVYHVGCALELATDILVDLYTFFRPPAPYEPLFTLTPPQAVRNPWGGSDAINTHRRDQGRAVGASLSWMYPGEMSIRAGFCNP